MRQQQARVFRVSPPLNVAVGQGLHRRDRARPVLVGHLSHN
ncbi:hypothetical protein [Deinococcus aetherius]|nr:hypothetical protein [Deinococcus aetherius]